MIKSILLVLIVFNTFLCSAQSHINQLPINTDVNIHDVHTPFNQTINQKKKTGIKTQKSLIWQWDTIYTYNEDNVLERHTQLYDNYGKPITQFKELINPYNNTWAYSDRHDYFYDSNSNDTLILCKQWVNDTWENYDRTVKHYNQNNDLLSEETEAWYSRWTKKWKWSYSYDSAGNVLTQLFETNYNDTLLVNGFRFTYTYDNNNNLLSTFQEDWQNGAWQNEKLDSLFYTSGGILISKTNIRWQDSTWNFFIRHTYSYYSNNLISTALCEKWNINAWVNLNIENYSYDNAGNLISYLLQYFQGDSLNNVNRYLYSYDLSGNMLTYTFQKWQNNTWDNNWNWKRSYSYDNNNNSITGKYEYLGNNIWLPGSDELLVFAENNIVYRLGNLFRYTAKFSNSYYNIESNENNCLTNLIYPNPASDNLTIDIPELKDEISLSVFNLQGQLVLIQDICQPVSKLDISNLVKGMYLVKILGKNISEVRKFVKQ